MHIMTPPEKTAEHFIARARRLYTLPAVAVRVLELTGEPHVDTFALAECIENDPALTSKILRVVNSSVFGLSQRVGNLKQAIDMLGIRPLKLLVLGFSLPANLQPGTTTEVLARYWRHTLLKAVAARELAQQCYGAEPDEPFLGGLLQNLGMLVLIQDLGPSYEKFLLNVWEECGDLAAEESSVLGFDHQFLTARLLEHWKLPLDFVETIETPHRVEQVIALEPNRRRLPQILHLAELIATFLIEQRPPLLEKILHVGQEYRGLTLQQLEPLMAALDDKTPQIAEVLALNVPISGGYAAILMDAHRRLAEILREPADMMGHATLRPLRILKAEESLSAEGPSAGQPPSVFVVPTASEPDGPAGRSRSPAVERRPEPGSRAAAEHLVDEIVSAGERQAALAGAFPWSTPEGLIGRLSIAVTRCRQVRSSLSLMLVELDELEKVTFYCGIERMPQVIKKLGVTIRDATESDHSVFQVDDGRFAVVLDDCDRRRAVELGWRIVDGVRQWKSIVAAKLQAGVSVSAGVASLNTPPRNFPAEELLMAAQRCLSGVQLSGGNGIKSIDIY